ncbi:hypothetical protein BGZ72_006339 [Mortierella alpina]|nr:hypothetical protein BGZ72_006339 [Mortierella alpina]
MTALHSSQTHNGHGLGPNSIYDSSILAHKQLKTRTGPVAFAHESFKQLTLYTGNTMRTGTTGQLASNLNKSNQELLLALEETLHHSLETAEIKDGAITVADKSTLGSLEGDRSTYEITAKLFFISSNAPTVLSVEQLNHAIQNLQTALGSSSLVIDNFILALPNQTFDENGQDESELQEFKEDVEQLYWPVWKALSALRQEGQIKRLGVSEFSKQQLEILKSVALAKGAVAPEVNQVNLQDCCVLPKGLIDYAKAEGIELLTHGDATNILPGPTLSTLLQAHLPAAAASPLVPKFVLKYSALITNRGLVSRKGYIVEARSV